MEKKQKPNVPRDAHQAKRKEWRQQVKGLPTDLEYEVAGLPAELVYEILIRLPVKSLTRFRCVCKQWCSVISHPPFQQDHYRVCSQQDPLFLITRNEFDKVSHTNTLHFSMYDIDEETLVSNFSKALPLLPFGTDIRLMQSCQGLIYLTDHKYRKHIFFCNPSTRELIALPATKESSDCVAFGFTNSPKEFKAVRFFRRDELARTTTFCEVFTLDTSEWREASCPPQDRRFGPRAYFLHGAIHLEPLGGGPIHAFNIETEEYKVIPLPKIPNSFETYFSEFGGFLPLHEVFETCFSEFGGFLCLTVYYESRYEIWLLKDYNNGKWVKEYTIDNLRISTPLAGLSNGNILINVDVGDGGVLYYYNPRDKSYRQKLEKFPRASATWHGDSSQNLATLHVESLFALNRHDLIRGTDNYETRWH